MTARRREQLTAFLRDNRAGPGDTGGTVGAVALDGDGHLAMMPAMAPRFGLHPAHTYSVTHHRDIMAAVPVLEKE